VVAAGAGTLHELAPVDALVLVEVVLDAGRDLFENMHLFI
jgi:hypothetical protein